MSEKIIKLDKLERRLLRELDINARQTYVALERKLGVPAETIRYRTNTLVERGVISHFSTLIHTGFVGNDYYKVLLKFYNVNESVLQEIVKDLKENLDVNWIARLDGRFDIAFTIRVKNIRGLSDFLDTFKQCYREYIHRLIFAVNIEVEFLSRDYLTGKKTRSAKPASYEATEQAQNIDDVDLKILRALADDARASSSQIAAGIGVTTETVLQRIKRLEKSGVIVRYCIFLDNSILPQDNYYIFLYLNYVSGDRIKAFLDYCRKHPNIIYFIKALGEWDYEFSVEVENLAEYRALMMDLTSNFSDIIRDYLGMPVSKIYKFTLAP